LICFLFHVFNVHITAGADTCGRDTNTSTAPGSCKIGAAEAAGENPVAGQ